MNIALLQLPSLQTHDERLDKYLRTCKKQKVQLVALGEYVLNPFYKEFGQSYSKDIIASFSQNILENLSKLSKKYKIEIIAPILFGESNKLYKGIALIKGQERHLYTQQRLIEYEHWNERTFFDNPYKKRFSMPITFERENLKYAMIAGFEIHFDEIWVMLKKAKIDVVIIPCANTFGSKVRWRNLCQMRAFTNSMAILRVNRVGELCYDEIAWQFYGDSLYIDAQGEVQDHLDAKEGMILLQIHKDSIEEIRKEWKFR